ncbi:MAG: hypothetical protein LBT82_01095 [Oscillospiraceae bacterium]|jgi:hypothetical protein|nr:hypothetical protein [Oscillospiraceae bacterium]
MRTLLNIFSMITVLVVTSFLIFSKLLDEGNYWRKWGETSDCKSIYVNFYDKKDEHIYEVLTNAAKTHNVSFIKTDFLNSEKNKIGEKIVKSVFLTNPDINLFTSENLISGNFLTSDQSENNMFISTLDKQGSSGKLFDFLEAYDVEIQTFKRLLDFEKSLKGEYVVRYLKTQDLDAFITEVSQKFNISEKTLTTPNGFGSIANPPILFLSILGLIIVLAILFLTSIFYLVKNLKIIGVSKLCGHSNKKIFSDLFSSVFYSILISSSVIDFFICIFFKNISKDFSLSLIFGQLFILFLVFLSLIPAFLLLKKYKMNDMILNRSPVKLVYKLIFLTKQASLVVLIFASFLLPEFFILAGRINEKVGKWEKFKNFATVETVFMGNDFQSFCGESPEFNLKTGKLFEYLNLKYDDCFYIKHDDFVPNEYFRRGENKHVSYYDKNLVKEGETLKNLTVNPNYVFKSEQLNNLENKKIILNNDDDFITILVPKSNKLPCEVIEKLYLLRAFKRENYKEEFYDSSFGRKIKIVVYNDSKTNFFTFNRENDKEDFLKSPFIEVIPLHLMSIFEKGLFSGEACPLKIDLKNKATEKFSEEIKGKILEFNLEQNKLEFKKYGEIFSDILKMLFNIMRLVLTLVLILFFILFLLSLQNIKIYLETYKKQIFVKKVYGIKIFDIYRVPIFIFCTAFILNSVMASLLMSSYKNSIPPKPHLDDFVPYNFKNNLIMCFIVFLLDFSISFFIVKFYEKKKISNVIKEN